MRTRPRNKISFEPLMISPEQVDAFFGVESEGDPTTSNICNTPEVDEQSEKRESTQYNFQVTDNSLWRTMPTPSEVYDEDQRELTGYGFHVADHALSGRKQTEHTEYRQSDQTSTNTIRVARESTTAYNFHVTDNSLWRTTTSPYTDSESTNQRRSDASAYNFHVTDNSLWRTTTSPYTDSEFIGQRRSDASVYNFCVTDNSLWRTMHIPPGDDSIAVSNREDPTSEFNSPVHVPFSFKPIQPNRNVTPVAVENETQAAVAEMSPKDGQSGDVNQQTSPKNLTEQPEQSEGANQQTPSKSPSLARPHIDFHFTTPTRASLAKSKEKVLLPCGRCERAEKVVDVPRPEKKRPRESVEVYTQTSANRNRRHTVLQMMHEKSPGLPRRSIFFLPTTTNDHRRRITNLAPFFNRLSTGSESNTSTRTSTGTSTSNAPTVESPPLKSKIPIRSPCSPPSVAKSSPARHSPARRSSPRLVDRVRVNEAFKSLTGTPLTSKVLVEISPKIKAKTPPPTHQTEKSPSSSPQQIMDENPQIIHLTNALQQIGIDYKTPDSKIRTAAGEGTSSKKKDEQVDFDHSTTPTRDNLFNSLFRYNEAKSGVIPARHPVMNPNAKPRALFDIGNSFDDTSFRDDEGPMSQQIPSQQPNKFSLSLLDDDDFQLGSPSVPCPRKRSTFIPGEIPRIKVDIPNESRFVSATPPHLPFDLDDSVFDSVGNSIVSGGSDRDTDVDSPTPKHIILRNKPKKKPEPYMYLQPPKMVKGTDEFASEHPHLRRSTRTRFSRHLAMGEKPIYERDENGDYNLVGVRKGYTADPLCKKFGTFNKDEAMEMQKEQTHRRKRIREQNRARRAMMNEKYGVTQD